MRVAGAGIAYRFFGRTQPTTEAMYAAGGAGYRFLLGKWYFDEVYDAAIVNPTVQLAKATAAADKRPTDGPPPQGEAELPPKRFDLLHARRHAERAGAGRRRPRGGRCARCRPGDLRTYVVVLALTAALMLGILTALAK